MTESACSGYVHIADADADRQPLGGVELERLVGQPDAEPVHDGSELRDLVGGRDDQELVRVRSDRRSSSAGRSAAITSATVSSARSPASWP